MITIKKKTNYILLIVIGIIILILAFIPGLVKDYVIDNSEELIGRKIDIGKLKYNYFSSTVRVYDFKLFEQNEQGHFTTFDTLILNLEPIKLLIDKIEIEQFYLKGLMVKTVMKDSTFSFDDLIAFHSEPVDSLNTEEPEPFKYSISNIELKNSNFYFDNKNVGRETHIEDLSFIIPKIGWDQEEKSNANIKFNFKKGGYLESSFNVNPVDGEFDALITIKDLYLNPFYEYVVEYVEINDFKGLLNSQIKIEGNTNEVVNSIVSGHVDVREFIMTDKSGTGFLKANRIDCNLKSIDYANSSYVLDSLKFTKPYVYFEMDSITNNFFKTFRIEPSNEVTNEKGELIEAIDTTSNSNLYYAINHLTVQDGILDYSDNLTGERFDYHLSEIEMNSENILSDSKWIDINSDMLLNNRGTLNAKLGLNPSDYNNLNLDMTIENFLLSDINIYSNYYTGHNILEGDFYYYSQSKITNGDIESENQLLVKNVSVSNEEGGLYALPLRFALFLLKDKNGDVNLEIPVRGDLNDPEVSVGKIVWNTFKNLIVKTVASPINFLAGLVDGDPKEFEELKFSYTDTIPSEKQFRKLDKLLEMETKKEGLKIEMIHYVDKKLQQEAIVFSELGKQYFIDTEKDYLKDEKGFESYLRTKVSNDSIPIKDAAFQLIKPQTADSLGTIINRALMKNTTEYLRLTKDSTNITVSKSELKEPKNIGSISKFKIKYDMLDEKSVQTDTLNTKN
ncbi:MAG: hypothetical protein ACI8ZM_005655 [Crocinitomix sp.]|jgi:hypothetical protein